MFVVSLLKHKAVRRRVLPWAVSFATAVGGLLLIVLLMVALGGVAPTAPETPTKVPGIPPVMLDAYVDAATATGRLRPDCVNMRWQVLAGVGKVESDHARHSGNTVTADGDVQPPILGPRLDGSDGTQRIEDTDNGRWDHDSTFDRAVGPLQFIPTTWNALGGDGNRDGLADPNNAYDATRAAVLHLCGNQPRDFNRDADLKEALHEYNPDPDYAPNVMRWIEHYDQYNATPTGSGKGQRILDVARRWEGWPYSWGGGDENGPSYGGCCSPNGSDGSRIRGFDCSGLTLHALAQVGITGVVHSATWQWLNAEELGGRQIPASQGIGALRAGDLVFFGGGRYMHHVGIYIGDNKMFNAARPGTDLRVDPMLPDYAGAARFP